MASFGILGKAAAGAGEALYGAGLMTYRDQLMEAREARLAKYQAERDERMFGQQEKMQERTIAATKEEGEATRALTREEGGATRQTQKELAEMHEREATKRHGQSMGAQAAMNTRLSRQLEIAEKESDINRAIKQIELDNLKDIAKLREEFPNAAPERKDQIREILATLNNKSDRFLEVGEYNDMGQRVGSKLFDTVSRKYVSASGGAAAGDDPLGLGLKPKNAAKDGEARAVSAPTPTRSKSIGPIDVSEKNIAAAIENPSILQKWRRQGFDVSGLVDAAIQSGTTNAEVRKRLESYAR